MPSRRGGRIRIAQYPRVAKTYAMKLWWAYKYDKSLWQNFLRRNMNHQNIKFRQGEQEVVRMYEGAKYKVEANTKWLIGRGEIDAKENR